MVALVCSTTICSSSTNVTNLLEFKENSTFMGKVKLKVKGF